MAKIGKLIKKYFLLTVYCSLFGVGLSLFIDPNNLAPGGVSGLSILLSRVFPVETGTLFLILNIPILIIGIYKFGWKFIISTLYATVMVSFFTNLLEPVGALTSEPLLGALAGSVLNAVGMGMVLRSGATTGGTDIIVKCLRVRYPHLKSGVLFFIIDIFIVLLSGIVFGQIDSMLYSAIAVFTTSTVLDKVLYGTDGAKLFFLISDQADGITARLLAELNIGVTYLKGSGAYNKNEKQVVLCAMRKQLVPKAEKIVREEDEKAFLIITNATEIYGEGHKSYFGDVI